MKCRNYGETLSLVVCDLVSAPMSNAYHSGDELNEPEIYYSLCMYVCDQRWLIHIEDYKKAHEIFGEDYRHYSSYSSLWLRYAEEFVKKIVPRLELPPALKVMEIALNYGCFLQYFKTLGIPFCGRDSTKDPDQKANDIGIETIVAFFNTDFADEYVADASDFKQGIYLPVSWIPIMESQRILLNKQDFVKIITWNSRDEIMDQLRYIRKSVDQFIIQIPHIQGV